RGAGDVGKAEGDMKAKIPMISLNALGAATIPVPQQIIIPAQHKSSLFFLGHNLVEKYPQNPKGNSRSYEYLKHYFFSFTFIRIAAPRHVKKKLNPRPTNATRQSALRADCMKTPARNTRDIFRKCFPISFIPHPQIQDSIRLYYAMKSRKFYRKLSVVSIVLKGHCEPSPVQMRHWESCLPL
ncbi:MAG: hypothetical protein ACLFUT_02575, partial [Desulfobacteraceae bacterium]